MEKTIYTPADDPPPFFRPEHFLGYLGNFSGVHAMGRDERTATGRSHTFYFERWRVALRYLVQDPGNSTRITITLYGSDDGESIRSLEEKLSADARSLDIPPK